MIGQGVSSRSSHSAAAGRTTFSAKPWTHSRMSSWSWLRAREKVVVSVSGAAASADMTEIVTGRHTMIHTMASSLAARADRERQIVAATRALFDEQGVQEAAIDGIARAVGINKALIYRHVASKEELFILVMISYLAELRDGYPRDRSDPMAALRETMNRYTAFCLEFPAFLDCALSLMRRPAAELRERVSEGTWLRLGRAMGETLAPLAAMIEAAGV